MLRIVDVAYCQTLRIVNVAYCRRCVSSFLFLGALVADIMNRSTSELVHGRCPTIKIAVRRRQEGPYAVSQRCKRRLEVIHSREKDNKLSSSYCRHVHSSWQVSVVTKQPDQRPTRVLPPNQFSTRTVFGRNSQYKNFIGNWSSKKQVLVQHCMSTHVIVV